MIGDLLIGVLGIYLLIVNVVAFAMYGVDKRKAIKKAYRIPEKQLIGVAIIGGSVGAVLGMRIFRHKTLHGKFAIGLPAILFVHMVIACGIYTYIL